MRSGGVGGPTFSGLEALRGRLDVVEDVTDIVEPDSLADAGQPRAVRWTRRGLAGMFVAGAAGHAVFASVVPEIYEAFADGSQFVVVREAWRDLFVPNARLLAAGLGVFELGLGVLFAVGGCRATRVAVAGAMAFHVALVAFGWWYLLWSVPMLGLLLWFDRNTRDRGAA